LVVAGWKQLWIYFLIAATFFSSYSATLTFNSFTDSLLKMNPLPGQSGAVTAQDDTIFRTLAAYADALDALPLDLTRSFSDLRELDAVLGGKYFLVYLSPSFFFFYPCLFSTTL